jgi:hypothetical protein
VSPEDGKPGCVGDTTDAIQSRSENLGHESDEEVRCVRRENNASVISGLYPFAEKGTRPAAPDYRTRKYPLGT